MQIDVIQREFFCFFGVFEAHAVKVDGAVLYGGDRIGGVFQSRLFFQYFADTLDGFVRHRQHYVDH